MRPSPAKTTIIEIEQFAVLRQPLDLKWLRAQLDKVLDHITQPAGEINIAIVDDQRMSQLHRRHCGVDQTTDVLTFPPSHENGELDLAICADEAARQSAQRGHCIERELLLYCIHGLLHCAGFDDHDEAGYHAMHAEEDRILTAIGVGPTFSNAHGVAAPDGATTCETMIARDGGSAL